MPPDGPGSNLRSVIVISEARCPTGHNRPGCWNSTYSSRPCRARWIHATSPSDAGCGSKTLIGRSSSVTSRSTPTSSSADEATGSAAGPGGLGDLDEVLDVGPIDQGAQAVGIDGPLRSDVGREVVGQQHDVGHRPPAVHVEPSAQGAEEQPAGPRRLGPVRTAAHGDGEVARQPHDLAALALVERLQRVAERRPAQPERRGVEVRAPDRPHRLQRAVGADGAIGRRTRQAGVPQLDATVDAGGVGPVDPPGAGQWRQHQAVGQLDGGLGDGRRGRLGAAGELFCGRRRRECVGRHARFPRVPVEQRLERQRQLGLLGREPKGEARGVCRGGGDGCRDERLLACGGLVESPLLDVLGREGDDDEGVDVETGTGSDGAAPDRRSTGRG